MSTKTMDIMWDKELQLSYPGQLGGEAGFQRDDRSESQLSENAAPWQTRVQGCCADF